MRRGLRTGFWKLRYVMMAKEEAEETEEEHSERQKKFKVVVLCHVKVCRESK